MTKRAADVFSKDDGGQEEEEHKWVASPIYTIGTASVTLVSEIVDINKWILTLKCFLW